ncbi:hypothetical protein D3C78_1581240 [compost metagenome]
MLDTEARKVRGVTTTSSPAPMPSALRATSRATVPFSRAMAYSAPAHSANSFSNWWHSSPVQ